MPDLNEILSDTIAAVEEMKRNGVTHVEVSKATLDELGRKPRPAAAPAKPAAAPLTQRPKAVPAPTAPAVPVVAATGDWTELQAKTMACVKCRELAGCRQNVVFGVGNQQAELMFIGEAPGADEDEQGEPFVGRAGQLLTKIIEAMGLKREEVYIANVLKCRPPENRKPLPDEMTNCLPFLLRQIELIQPKIIVALGATAMQGLVNVDLGITKMRGTWYDYKGIPVMPTFHPAYLLRNPPAKRPVWDDMKAVVAKLGRELPPQSR